MEVPRRPQPPTLTLTLADPAPAPPCAIGPKQKSSRRNATRQKVRLEKAGGPEEEEEEEEEAPAEEKVCSDETPQLLHVNQARPSRLPSEDSFSEDASVSEEVLAEEARRKSEAEEAAAREREAQRQQMSIEELVQSERSYLKMLELSTGTIRSRLQELQPPPTGLDTMFLYIQEVMDVSTRLLSMLDQLQPGDPRFLENLCESFLRLSSDIEAAYREYLANYTHVTVLENGYKQKEALWKEMVTIIKASAPEVNASSLSFFLVMPVQRIARYPLLLQTIQKHTDPSHPVYALLEQTAHTSVALNCRINEYKRFREVADKYKKTENLTIRDKIVRLNTHSIAKKTARFSQHIKHETGMAPKIVDEEFEALEGFFAALDHGILQLLENVETYLLNLQGFLACRTEEFDFDMDGEKSAVCYKEITTALRQWVLPTFEKRMRTLIHKPLCALRDLLVGPRNLIRKRFHKLLDYEVMEGKANLSFDEQEVVNTYKTLNTLLLTELPRFNGMALQMIWGMLGTFSCLHKDLTADMEQLFQSFAQQLPHSFLSDRAFWEWAESAILDGAWNLQALCQTVEETLNAPVVQPLSPSAHRRLQQLTGKHGSGKIYQVTSSVVASRDLDLNLTKGELVALVSGADTRGDKRRWLVDAGGRRGYVASSKLVRYHQAAEDPPPSPHPGLPENVTGYRRFSYSPGAPPLTSQPCFQVMAAYNFTARGNHEVSLQAGQPVRVLEPHDKRGNPEWSLVEVGSGQRGYVPSNYLTLQPMEAGPPVGFYPFH